MGEEARPGSYDDEVLSGTKRLFDTGDLVEGVLLERTPDGDW